MAQLYTKIEASLLARPPILLQTPFLLVSKEKLSTLLFLVTAGLERFCPSIVKTSNFSTCVPHVSGSCKFSLYSALTRKKRGVILSSSPASFCELVPRRHWMQHSLNTKLTHRGGLQSWLTNHLLAKGLFIRGTWQLDETSVASARSTILSDDIRRVAIHALSPIILGT